MKKPVTFLIVLLIAICTMSSAFAGGWKKSYHAGTFDKNFRYMGRTELMFLTSHKGKLYAATSMWDSTGKKGPEEKKAGQKTADSNTGQRFADNGDETVSDTKTGLMWLKDAKSCGKKDWVSAKSYCENLIYAAYSDWRLPTELELRGIGSNSSGTWTKPAAPFVNVQSSNYWSVTGSAINPDQAWSVYMKNGQRIYYDKSHNDYVWPVRGGN